MRRLLSAALLLLFAEPLHAEWYEASSDHFLVYADDKEKDVARFARMLEQYHSALEVVTGREVPVPSPSNRVTIFAVGNNRDMRRLSGSRDIAGFYVPRAGMSRAFVPNIKFKHDELDFSLVVLLHEYAHHFFISSSRNAMPNWLSEGAAEFFASALFPDDGSVQIARPASHRSYEILLGDKLEARRLLSQIPAEEESNSFYGRSWLLYHYLFFDPSRTGQLTAYWEAVASGTPPMQAAETIFGDLDKLDRDLTKYQNQRKLSYYSLSPDSITTSPVTVRRVSEGLGEMLPVIISSQRGVDREQALELVPEARRVAAKWPNDANVLAALAEAEIDAGFPDAAIAAADRALALDPSVKNALLQKGLALFSKAQDASDKEAAFRAAMAPFTALNRLENDHPLPLMYYYSSFVLRGAEPDEQARHALERAAELAPFDQQLWLTAALMQASEGKIDTAKYSLEPLAANPHGGPLVDTATRLLGELASIPEGTPVHLEPSDESIAMQTDSPNATDDPDGAPPVDRSEQTARQAATPGL